METMILRESAEVLMIPVDGVSPSPYQPRRLFERAELADLADSIREYGVLQPITVRRIGGRYELVAGERRLRASRLAGRETIPAIVVAMSDRDSAVLALVENLQRRDLNYIEEAEGLANLAQDYRLTQDEIARRIGKSQSTVANKLRILRLPQEVKRLLLESDLTERHARALLKLEALADAPKAQLAAARKAARAGLNVKETERLVEAMLAARRPAREKPRVKTYIADIRLFTNTIKHAVDVMNSSGLTAVYDVEPRRDGYYISISITQPA